ncbi:MAG: hypothetical protein AAFW68_09015 [Pseudomonadota bacterium]
MLINSRHLRPVRNIFLASAAIVGLHACATAPTQTLTPDQLLTAPYALRGGAPFDVDAMLAAMPDWLIVEHGGARFDEALGAMVISDLRFALSFAPDAALVVERAVMWGGDPVAARDVFSGASSLIEKRAIFDRMSMDNIRSEGLQWDTGAQSASLSIDKMVIDGLAARSYALSSIPGSEEGVDLLRHFAAATGAYAYDGAAYAGFSMRFSNNRGDNTELTIEEGFARGYDAGAVDYQSLRGLYARVGSGAGGPVVEISGQQSEDAETSPYAKILNRPPAEAVNEALRSPAAFLAQMTGGFDTEYEIAFTETRAMDLSGAFAWLARWELPPITETDLIDLGAQTMLGYRQTWNGAPIYTLDRAEVAASDFYWLVPSNYSVAYQGFTYQFDTAFGQMLDQMGPGFATEAAPAFEQTMQTFSALGLDRMAGDMDMDWRWDGVTGDAALSLGMDIIDLTGVDFQLSAGGPSLARWEQMARQDTPVTEAATEIALKEFRYSLTDFGIIDRAFAFAAEQNGAGSGPELRQSMVAMARLSGAQMGEADPRLPTYANAVADFLDAGGTITLLAAPPSPVTLMQLQAASQSAPQSLPELLNITITHTE